MSVRAQKSKEEITQRRPESANADDSLAEAYMNDGQKELAIQNYEKSLAKNPRNRNAFAMLKKLRGESE